MNDDGVIHRLVGKAAEAMGGPAGEALRAFVFKSGEDRLAKSQLIFIRYVPGVQLRPRSVKSFYESRKLQFGFPVSHGSLMLLAPFTEFVTVEVDSRAPTDKVSYALVKIAGAYYIQGAVKQLVKDYLRQCDVVILEHMSEQ